MRVFQRRPLLSGCLRSAGRLFISICLLALVVFLTSPLWLRGIGHWLAVTPQPGQADAIVVLSGGTPRLVRGISLYREGIAPELWYSGGTIVPGEPQFGDGDYARRLAVAGGVPEEKIRLLPSTSSWEDAQGIVAEARREGVDRILVITDWYHSRRALCSIRHHLASSNVSIYYEPPQIGYGPDNWWRNEDGVVSVTNELLKFGFYWFNYGLAPWRC